MEFGRIQNWSCQPWWRKKTFGAQPRELVQQGSQGVLSVQPTSGIIRWMFETCITIVSRHDGCQAMSWYVITRLQSNLTFGILRLYTWYDPSSYRIPQHPTASYGTHPQPVETLAPGCVELLPVLFFVKQLLHHLQPLLQWPKTWAKYRWSGK